MASFYIDDSISETPNAEATGFSLSVVGLGIGSNTSSSSLDDKLVIGDSNYYLTLATDPYISFDANDYITFDRSENIFRFYIDGVEQMSLDANGDLIIAGYLYGNTAGSAGFDKQLDDNEKLFFGTGSDVELLYEGANFVINATATTDSDILIKDGNTTRFTFDTSAGDFTATGDITAYSDERIKTDIQTIDNSLDIVKNLRGVSYYRKDNLMNKKIGLIAQEVLPHLPEVVSTDKEGVYTLNYGNIVGLLINAIKELNDQMQDLKSKIEK